MEQYSSWSKRRDSKSCRSVEVPIRFSLAALREIHFSTFSIFSYLRFFYALLLRQVLKNIHKEMYPRG